MNNKPVIILTSFLLVVSSAAAGLGFYQSKKPKNIEPIKPEEKITYEYYLDDVLQTEMPNNISTDENGNTINTNTYVFSRFVCDQNISINFDNENWTFTPSEEKTATCKLYFAQSYYDVTLAVSNGVYEGENPSKVQRDTDASLLIVPSEGYEYKDVSCSNNKTANYDMSSNTLNIRTIMENVACKIDFEIKKLKMNVTVKNGKENTTETVNYGESVSVVIEPNSGYESPKITCTNNQTAVFKDNKLTIDKLTDNTNCTVTFNKIKPKTYKMTITLPKDNVKTITDESGIEKSENIVTIVNGSTETNYEEGKDAVFSLKVLDGYTLKLDCGGVVPSKELQDEADNQVTNYTFLKIDKDISCNVSISENSN